MTDSAEFASICLDHSWHIAWESCTFSWLHMYQVLATAEGDLEKRLELVNAEWGNKQPICIAVMNGAADVVQLRIDAGAQLHNLGASARTMRPPAADLHQLPGANVPALTLRVRRWSASVASSSVERTHRIGRDSACGGSGPSHQK